jgi:NAD(P)-dependent dehydrogenase (short-subunit alcohol dehydrogenase family)
MKLLDGQTAIVTGAGRGIGRGEAVALASAGAVVVVNDVAPAGDDGRTPAEAVAAEIVAAGGRAIASHDDVSDWDACQHLVTHSLELTDRLDIIVCNAGIVRDRTVHKLGLEEWDDVLRVNLRGCFLPTRFAAEIWRARTKETGAPSGGRVILTSSEAGMYGNIGQANYAASKAGIMGLCFTAAQELVPLGATVNVVSPRARTPMTEAAFGAFREGDSFDEWDPANVAPWVVFLASDHAGGINGQVFVVHGGMVRHLEGWVSRGEINKPRRWELDELIAAASELIPGLRAEPPTLGFDMPAERSTLRPQGVA